MSKLAYFASPVPDKETWFETPEGYRIYRSVPICRSGSQFYLGRELKKNSGYHPMWGLKDEQQYQVFRPVREVTDSATIASFEGKSVLDMHPPDKTLVDALDEYDGISQGHMQNVRVGKALPSGETPLVADLWVKNPELNLKVEAGTREVSCGYTFILAKDEAGRLIMTKIRGNHVAVVPRGRAGPEIAIGDAAVDANHQPTQKGKDKMSMSERLIRAVKFQNWLKDAKPEEVAEVLEKVEKGSVFDSNAPIGDVDVDFSPDIPTTTVEELEQAAKREAGIEKVDDLDDPLPEYAAGTAGTADAAPSVMAFFNGRPYDDGRKAYNQARIAQGLPPISEGRR